MPPGPVAVVAIAIIVFATNARAAPAEVELSADLAALPASERATLAELVRTTALMDALFLRQVWGGNEALLVELARDTSAAGLAHLAAFRREHGPWLRGERDRPFVEGVGEKPLVGSFYPAGSTRAELETWLNGLDADGHAAATSAVTTIRRSPSGLVVVPYSREHQPELARAAAHLRKAATFTSDKALANFLELRAAAFASNDYQASDRAWMKLPDTQLLEVTLGPHEIDEDGWFNAKASFQGFVGVRHAAGSAALASVRAHLQDIEDHLPLPPEQRTRDVAGRPGAAAPIRIVDLVHAAGDEHRALATGAYLLPNDERITRELGSKRVILRNVHEARWRMLVAPLARGRVTAPSSFAAHFQHLVSHELMHLIGPRQITVKGRRTSVTESLHETYGVIEEAKADILALWALDHLAEVGVVPKALTRELPGSFLAAALETLRFGTKDVHAQGLALVLESWLASGAIALGKTGFTIDPARFRSGVRELATELLAIEANGDRARASALIKTRAVLRPELKAALAPMAELPRAIGFRFARVP
jgi:hypothetical protein